MTPSQVPPGNLPSPGIDDPSAPPHPVPAYSPARWPAALVRMWRSLFPRDAFAYPADAEESAPSGRHFFPGRAKRAEKNPPPN